MVYWTSSGNFWMAGGEGTYYGEGFNSAKIGLDVWKFDIASKKWTWIAGYSTSNPPKIIDGLNLFPGSIGPPDTIFRSLYKSSFGYSIATNTVWFIPTNDSWLWNFSPFNLSFNRVTPFSNDSFSSPRIKIGAGIIPVGSNLLLFAGGALTHKPEMKIGYQGFEDLWSYYIPTHKWNWISGIYWNSSSSYSFKMEMSPTYNVTIPGIHSFSSFSYMNSIFIAGGAVATITNSYSISWGTINYFFKYTLCNDSSIFKSTDCALCETGRTIWNNTLSRLDTCRSKCSPGNLFIEPDACLECPPGKFSSDYLANYCQNCSIGLFSRFPGSSTCYPCSIGTYSNVSTAANCIYCEQGRYIAIEGSSFCYSCNPGYSSALNSSTCFPCSSGKFSSEFAANCSNCHPGKFSEYENSTECLNCLVGKYSADYGSKKCSSCPGGKISQIISSTGSHGPLYCINCPAGKFRSNDSTTVCLDCIPGFYSTEGVSSCIKCPFGKAGPLQGATACNDCEKGKYMSEQGFSSCLDCRIGFYSDENGFDECRACPVGRFLSVMGASFCNQCPLHSTTSNEGSISQKSCICEEGYFGSAYNGNDCRECSFRLMVKCDKNSTYPAILEGFCRDSSNPNMIYECFPKEACKSTSSIQMNTPCSDGYTGTLCGSCISLEFYKQGSKCRRCPSMLSKILTLVGILFSGIAASIFVLKRGIYKMHELKIMVFWIQLISSFSSISSSWPVVMQTFFKYLSVSSLNIDVASPGKKTVFTFKF
jgi:hypothetical protein